MALCFLLLQAYLFKNRKSIFHIGGSAITTVATIIQEQISHSHSLPQLCQERELELRRREKHLHVKGIKIVI